MFDFFKRRRNKNREFDWSVLKKRSLPILILDERWHGIFKNIEKTREIIEKEEVLKELLKEEARLAFEKKEILARRSKNIGNQLFAIPTPLWRGTQSTW